MIGRLHQHALARLNFEGETSAAKRLAACKTFLRLENAMIRMRHEAAESGQKIARAHAAMIDALLERLFTHAMAAYRNAHGEPPSPISLVALGGYGRAELCPLSDIDIMFLFSAKTKAAAMKPLLEHLINEVLYPLWDCGLKVGHSTRTLDEVIDEARKDIRTKTSLLESRLVAGAPEL